MKGKRLTNAFAAARSAVQRLRDGDQVSIITPGGVEDRGCQLSFRVLGGPKRGRRIFDVLAVHGVVGDWREPDIIRIAPVPIYNRYVDVYQFVDELVAALQEIA